MELNQLLVGRGRAIKLEESHFQPYSDGSVQPFRGVQGLREIVQELTSDGIIPARGSVAGGALAFDKQDLPFSPVS